MQGSLKRVGENRWRIRYETRGPDPAHPGHERRVQKCVTFRGNKKDAQAELDRLVGKARNGTVVDASALTVVEWLVEWLAGSQSRLRPSTAARYTGIIEQVRATPLGAMRLQALRPTHLEAYYAALRAKNLSNSTLTLHHAVIFPAMKKAAKANLIEHNPALDLDNRPRRSKSRQSDAARQQAWTLDEAQRFLAVAKQAGAQPAAFYALALDTGMRKGELCGLTWDDVDFERGRVLVNKTLLTATLAKGHVVTGPTKTGRPRTIVVSDETMRLLRAHKAHQAELKMRNRRTYCDLNLAFAKEWSDVRKREDMLGHPLQLNNLGQREYAALIKRAGVRAITFHGMRHSCATLLLQAGEHAKVVSERLGHSTVAMTMEIYVHTTAGMQEQAAKRIGGLLHG